MNEGNLRREVERIVCELLAEQLKRRDPIRPDESFHRCGLDSLGAVAFMHALGEKLHRELPATLLFAHPTVDALVAFLTAQDQVRPRAHAAAADEPIAIVGIGCRLPGGADDPDALWDLLARGVDATSEIPAARWDARRFHDPDPAAKGKMVTRRGGFLERVDLFDPLFFGISPREAVQMDPQQRLMLELSWEALEDAGANVRALEGSRTGVFCGVFFNDYATLRDRAGKDAVDRHTVTGSVFSFIPNRVSHALGLCGPSIAVDSACSSSLVSVHLACQSLRGGECTLALAGGVHLVLAHETMSAVSQFGALSPDGRCFTFDARANGYARGEGGGVVVLKRLSAALRDGDRVYAIVRGSAVNNDGPSNGLTAPSPLAQEALLREACERADAPPATVGYVELHGTGTALGDPIEATALAAVYGAARPAGEPLLVGSLKTNFGHLEAAAGVVGLIKAALSVQRGAIAASLNFEKPSPLIDFARNGLRVNIALRPWSRGDTPLRAGVSSFGLGGTNAHVVIEAPPGEHAWSLAFQASDAGALVGEVKTVRAQVASAPTAAPLGPVLRALRSESRRAGPGRERAAFTATTRDELLRHLDAFVEGQPCDDVAGGGAGVASAPAGLVFVFSGMGSQWLGMGRRLFAEEPVFHFALEECDEALRAIAGFSLLDVLFEDGPGAKLLDLDSHPFYNPVVVAVQVAHAALWRSWGVRPRAVVGHCIGEVAAAYAAGILDVPDTMRVIHAIGQVYGKTVGTGGGLAAFTAVEPEEIERLGNGRVSLACDNDPGSCVVCGPEADVSAMLARIEARGTFCRTLSNVLTHCAEVEPYLAELRAALAGIAPRTAAVPMMSTTLERFVRGPELDGAYWAANIRQPVRFRQAVEHLAREGTVTFLELSAHAVLVRSIETTLKRAGRDGKVVRAQMRGEDGHRTVRRALAAVYAGGTQVDWDAVDSRGKDDPPSILALSAKSEGALRDLAGRHRAALARGEVSFASLAAAVAAKRDDLEFRASLVACSGKEADAALAALATAGDHPSLVTGRARGRTSGAVAFVFAGHGSTWPRMGLALMRESSYARELTAARDAIASAGGPDVLDVLARQGDARDEDPAALQACIFAVQVALAALWRSWGIVPEFVLGHSLGEIAAAHVAGALTLEDAARVIWTRGRLIREHRGPNGGMLAVRAGVDALASHLGPHRERVVVGAFNGPSSVTLSGDLAELAEIQRALAAAKIDSQIVNIAFAAHGPEMKLVAERMRAELRGLDTAEGTMAFISTVTGTRERTTSLTEAYWADNVALPVRFEAAMRELAKEGARTFVEIGGHPVLGEAIRTILDPHGREKVTVVSSLRKRRDERTNLLESAGALYCAGARLGIRGIHREHIHDATALPKYPWQRDRYWLEIPDDAMATVAGRTRDVLSEWLYEVAWPEQALVRSGTDVVSGATVILADDSPLAGALARRFEAFGQSCVIVRARLAAAPNAVAGHASDPKTEVCWVEPTRPEELGAVFAKVASNLGPVSRVLYLWGLGAAERQDAAAFPAEHVLDGRSLLATMHAIAGHSARVRPRLYLVTRGAQPVGGIAEGGLAQSALAGLGAVIALEQPQHWGGAIDLEGEHRADDAARLANEVYFGHHDEVVALRPGARHVARLARAPSRNVQTDRPLDREGRYLVTGGLGGVGRRVVSYLASRGARHLVVTGRTAGAETAASLVAELASLGAELRVVAADVADRAAMDRLFAELASDGRPLKGVVHSAGVVTWKDLHDLEAAELEAVARPKVRGAWNLHRLTEALDLDFFVLFSSIASVWGSRGQGAYAAANRFLDALAHHRRGRGLPAISIAWGPWAGGGMATEEYLGYLHRAGVEAMSPGDAASAFALFDSDRAHAIVADVRWERFRELYKATSQARLLDDVSSSLGSEGARPGDPGRAAEAADARAEAEHLLDRLARFDHAPLEQSSLVSAFVRARAGTILRLRASDIDPETPLADLGLDSLGAVELREALAEAGLVVDLVNLIEGASVADVTREALGKLAARKSGRPSRPGIAPRRSTNPGMPSAVVPADPPREAPLAEAAPAVVPAEGAVASRALANGWLVVPRPRDSAHTQLVCFPYAGGGPAVYQAWAKEVPPWVELAIAHLPGRGTRLRDAPLMTMSALADALSAAIAPCLTRPFAFFGHCLGALVMFEVAQRLRRDHGKQPVRFFASGARAPQFYNPAQIAIDVRQYSPLPDVPGQDLPDAMLLDMLRDLNFDTSAVLFENEEMRRLMLPAVRADFAVNNTYSYAPQVPLDTPITAFGGRVDPYVTGAHVLGWKEHTTRAFTARFCPGDHYFIERERPFLLAAVSEELAGGGSGA